jgi:hypothetical protein
MQKMNILHIPRSIWHNRTHKDCSGSDYKLKLHFDGSVSLDKEERHVRYADRPTETTRCQNINVLSD